MACHLQTCGALAATPADAPAWPRLSALLTAIGTLIEIWAEAAHMRHAAYKRYRLNGD